MKKIKIKTVIIIFLIISGCSSFVEVPPPSNLLVTENVFEDDATAIAAMTGIYWAMTDKVNMPYILPLYTGIAGDELDNYYGSNSQIYTNTLQAIDAPTNSIWNDAFNYVYQANAVYESCNTSIQLSTSVKRQIMAEALFVRAFWNFYLLNLFGEIPILTTADYLTNIQISRSSENEVYEKIIDDLKYAVDNLSTNYVNADLVSPSQERVRPNAYSARAMLSRVYLFAGKYSEAEEMATQILENKSLYDTVSIDKTFLKESKEAIWQLMKPLPTNSTNTYEGKNFILFRLPGNSRNNGTAISKNLLNSFEDGDKRKTSWLNKWVDASATPNVEYYYPYKYRVLNSTDVTEHSIVLRLAEIYLIRAEARAINGDISGAIADIDVIRNRAGLPLISEASPAIGKEELLSAILKERQTELFVEYGHRWLDLKRTGKIDDAMEAVATEKGITWNSYQQLWPIPQQSLDNAPNLKQNPGYN